MRNRTAAHKLMARPCSSGAPAKRTISERPSRKNHHEDHRPGRARPVRRRPRHARPRADALPLRIGADAPVGAAGTSTPAFRAEALRSDAASIEASRIPWSAPATRACATTPTASWSSARPPPRPAARGHLADGYRPRRLRRQGIPTRLDNPLGVVLAPVTIAANLGTNIVGGVLGGVGIVDNSRPSRAAGSRSARTARSASPACRPPATAATSTATTSASRPVDARTLALYQTYARKRRQQRGPHLRQRGVALHRRRARPFGEPRGRIDG